MTLSLVETLRVGVAPAYREAADTIECLTDALRPFVNVKDQFPQSGKLIDPKLDGLTPVTVTVTKAQFLAAHQTLMNLEKPL